MAWRGECLFDVYDYWACVCARVNSYTSWLSVIFSSEHKQTQTDFRSNPWAIFFFKEKLWSLQAQNLMLEFVGMSWRWHILIASAEGNCFPFVHSRATHYMRVHTACVCVCVRVIICRSERNTGQETRRKCSLDPPRWSFQKWLRCCCCVGGEMHINCLHQLYFPQIQMLTVNLFITDYISEVN